jgi:uncharacterized protein
MGRILFFALMAVAAYVGWQWLRRASGRGGQGPLQTRDAAAPEAMVSCAHCGLHLPRTDALPAGERFFCSEEHRQRGAVR